MPQLQKGVKQERQTGEGKRSMLQLLGSSGFCKELPQTRQREQQLQGGKMKSAVRAARKWKVIHSITAEEQATEEKTEEINDGHGVKVTTG